MANDEAIKALAEKTHVLVPMEDYVGRINRLEELQNALLIERRRRHESPSPMLRASAIALYAAHIEKLEAGLKRLITAFENVLLDIDFTIEQGLLPDVRDDITYVEARAAIEAIKTKDPILRK